MSEGLSLPSPEASKEKKKDDEKSESKSRQPRRFSAPVLKIESDSRIQDAKTERAAQNLREFIARSSIKEDAPKKDIVESAAKKHEESELDTVETLEPMETLQHERQTEFQESDRDQEHPDTQDAENQEDEPDQNAEGYSEMLEQALKPDQFGSEVVVNLQGEQPVPERVIPLRNESAAAAMVEQSEEAVHEYPIFTPQKLQQHQAQGERRPAESVPPEPEAAAAGNREMPSSGEPERSNAVPDGPEKPENRPDFEPTVELPGPQQVGAAEAISLAITNTASSERPATKQELDEAFARSAKTHSQRGVLSGLLFGTWFANRGLRRQQKQEAKQSKEQGKKVEQLTTEIRNTADQQRRHGQNVDHRFNTLERQKASKTPEKKFTKTERTPVQQRPEVLKPDAAEQLNVPVGHHLETSAWHTIEVDNKTGKTVETPAFQYGHEYYRERAAENVPADQRKAAAGGAVLAAISNDDDTAQPKFLDTQTANSTFVPDASVQGAPMNARDKTKSASSSGSVSANQAGPIWPWIVALVVVVVLLVAVIH